MIFVLDGHRHKYEPEKVCRLFLPFEKFSFEYRDGSEPDDGEGIYTSARLLDNSVSVYVCARLLGKVAERRSTVSDTDTDSADVELAVSTALFFCLTELTGIFPEWGMLTGIRPVKLYGRLTSLYGEAEAARLLKSKYSVSEEKLRLTADCYASEKKIIDSSRPEDFSLYVSIPFCPSRCSYCSFVSHSIATAGELIPDYVRLLCEELRVTARLAREAGLKLRTVYIGGGTPTALEAELLERVMSAVAESFDIKSVEEYTVEAGRPETVTAEKLGVIKRLGATRISINPQTANDSVLKAVGRRHTYADTVKAFYKARELGFDNINTDLISGLPTDTVDSFKNTVDSVLSLSPENITVHTLSMKRASGLTGAGVEYSRADGVAAAEMLRYADRQFRAAEIVPYYMYRQNKTVGNLENVGYSRPGLEGIYNIFIMDETHTILACGASAVTKLRRPDTDEIERIFNFKYPYEYISRFDTMLERKGRIAEFYGE